MSKKIKKYKCGTCQDKAFCNWDFNRFHFNFPNGVHLSVIWGYGSYTNNHDIFPEDNIIKAFKTFFNSSNCEVMFDGCSKIKEKKILKYFKTESQPLGYLTMKDFIWLFNKLSKSAS